MSHETEVLHMPQQQQQPSGIRMCPFGLIALLQCFLLALSLSKGLGLKPQRVLSCLARITWKSPSLDSLRTHYITSWPCLSPLWSGSHSGRFRTCWQTVSFFNSSELISFKWNLECFRLSIDTDINWLPSFILWHCGVPLDHWHGQPL